MAATRITYEGPNGPETYVGGFETEDMDEEGLTGFVAIDDSDSDVTDPDDKTLKMIPRSRIYSIENIVYDEERDRPTLNGEHR